MTAPTKFPRSGTDPTDIGQAVAFAVDPPNDTRLAIQKQDTAIPVKHDVARRTNDVGLHGIASVCPTLHEADGLGVESCVGYYRYE